MRILRYRFWLRSVGERKCHHFPPFGIWEVEIRRCLTSWASAFLCYYWREGVVRCHFSDGLTLSFQTDLWHCLTEEREHCDWRDGENRLVSRVSLSIEKHWRSIAPFVWSRISMCESYTFIVGEGFQMCCPLEHQRGRKSHKGTNMEQFTRCDKRMTTKEWQKQRG